TLNGNISGVGYVTRGRASGSGGIINLNGNNSGWSGGMFWSRGGLGLGHKSALGTASLTITNGSSDPNYLIANTDLTGANAIANAVSLTGFLNINSGSALELSGPITLGAGTDN